MKVVSWNVNSLKARQDRMLAFLERHSPDVVCIQELKLTDDAFPALELRAAGYHAVTYGQKTYNGVAILAKLDLPIDDVERGLGDDVDDPQARLIAGTIAGVRIISAYFPNGGTTGSDKYVYKLEWMQRLRGHLDRKYRKEDALLLAGDFNVAPDDLDVARPDEWRSSVLANDEVRAQLEVVRSFGLIDVFRAKNPAGQIYSWWDYRMLGFPKGNGLRIDHLFATPSLAARCVSAEVDRNERKGKLPSDHAPVIAVFS